MFFFKCSGNHRDLHSFPTRRSSDLDFRVLDREWVLAQANAVLNDMPVAAVKLGMLGNLEMVDTVVEILQAHPHLPLVCDPVLRAGGGGSLGKDEVGYAMREKLLPLARDRKSTRLNSSHVRISYA